MRYLDFVKFKYLNFPAKNLPNKSTNLIVHLLKKSRQLWGFPVLPIHPSSFCQKVQKPHLYWFYSGLTTNQFCESAAKKVILSWRILMRFSNSVIEAFSFDKNFCYSYSRSRNHHHHDHLSISHGVHYAHQKSFLNGE